MARWNLLPQEYNFTVIHKVGKLNTNVDCLTRFSNLAPVGVVSIPDWDRGDYNVTPSTIFMIDARMHGTHLSGQDDKEI